MGQEVPADAFAFPRLTSLSLGHASIGDDVAERIADLRSLQNLELTYCEIGNDGLKAIATLPELRRKLTGHNFILLKEAELNPVRFSVLF